MRRGDSDRLLPALAALALAGCAPGRPADRTTTFARVDDLVDADVRIGGGATPTVNPLIAILGGTPAIPGPVDPRTLVPPEHLLGWLRAEVDPSTETRIEITRDGSVRVSGRRDEVARVEAFLATYRRTVDDCRRPAVAP